MFERKHKRYSKTSETEQARRKRISQTMKGSIPANLQSLHSKPRTEEWKRKIGQGRKGKKHTEETKKKISEAKRNPLRPLYKAVRECYKSRQWREKIFRRDDYTCVLCKKRGGKLNADHFPKRFVDILRQNKIDTIEKALDCNDLWTIKNGRTLCVDCHSKTETYGFRSQK